MEGWGYCLSRGAPAINLFFAREYERPINTRIMYNNVVFC
ncbi:hypothetical protein ASZ90_019507 [hydrocarbon metagenome]|uniref:Uncharacterized protein n=1 Tax=hydrocarbon metagenome TaxID=938273 RepID=A0A0W8E338_9ZZZZ